MILDRAYALGSWLTQWKMGELVMFGKFTLKSLLRGSLRSLASVDFVFFALEVV